MSGSKPSPFSPGKLAAVAGLTLAGVPAQLNRASKNVVPRNVGKNVGSIPGYTGPSYSSSSYGNSSVAPSGFRVGSPTVGWNAAPNAPGIPPTKNWFKPGAGTNVIPASSTPMGANASYAFTMYRIELARERERKWKEEQEMLAKAAAARNAAKAAAGTKELGGGYKKHRKTRRRQTQRKTRKHRH